MGLRDDIQRDIRDALNGDLADADERFEFHSIEAGEYDPATGTQAQTITKVASSGVFDALTQKQLQNTNVKPNDVSLLVLQNELAARPKVDDELVWRERRFVVKSVEQDAASATWEMILRA